jgi:hypothetical protein
MNCEIAENVGYWLLKECDEQSYGIISLKRTQGIKNLTDLNKKGKKILHSNIDATNLFHRLIIIGE